MFDIVVSSASVAAIITLIGTFSKEKWFDHKNRVRQTKILAHRLHYILSEHAIKCAKQLDSTTAYKDLEEEGHLDSALRDYDYNIEIPNLVIDVREIDWVDLDIEIISPIYNIIFAIKEYQEDILCANSYMERVDIYTGQDYALNAFVRGMVNIGKSIIDILDKLEQQYKIVTKDAKIDGKSWKAVFISKNNDEFINNTLYK